ncbi:E3 ubiquitin-protein ligase rnf8-like isoform X2 [Thalassophryne amazonica]|uniref:E3 ubiquitin-protein ligase rnf8-like isoform X2 n=1 Tax=Thalassophryne amazonica TaxID=390379 RepID=UPI001471749C|nr:E3 ubiquitin-protein ligase rnf8-like isoform X2 [Thalassophryne amazonica]
MEATDASCSKHVQNQDVLEEPENHAKKLASMEQRIETLERLVSELEQENAKSKARIKEAVTEATEELGKEFYCPICFQFYINPVIINCGHTFCWHCLSIWWDDSPNCPICRQTIELLTRCLPLMEFIDKMVDRMGPEHREKREALITERKQLDEARFLAAMEEEDANEAAEAAAEEEEDGDEEEQQ